jgi:hypothetical protein
MCEEHRRRALGERGAASRLPGGCLLNNFDLELSALQHSSDCKADIRRPHEDSLEFSGKAVSSLSRWPRQRAGFSPWRHLRTVAQSSTVSMRPRSPLAVSGFSDQIGSITMTGMVIDEVQWQVADNRIGVSCQCRGPLRRVN